MYTTILRLSLLFFVALFHVPYDTPESDTATYLVLRITSYDHRHYYGDFKALSGISFLLFLFFWEDAGAEQPNTAEAPACEQNNHSHWAVWQHEFCAALHAMTLTRSPSPRPGFLSSAFSFPSSFTTSKPSKVIFTSDLSGFVAPLCRLGQVPWSLKHHKRK
jgi:hypothetical protein